MSMSYSKSQTKRLESTQTDHYIVFIQSYVNSNHNYAIVSCMWITCSCLYRGFTSSLPKFSTTVEVFLPTCFQSTEYNVGTSGLSESKQQS